MAPQPRPRRKPSSNVPVSPESMKPERARSVSLKVHGRAVPGVIFRAAVAPVLGDKVIAAMDPSDYAQSVIARMEPRDAVEEMLIAQMLFAHARVMRLTALANLQTSLDSIRTVHEYADRASNTYRRLMLALAEYRRPPRTGDTFAVVKQANIAHQQVVQNHEIASTNATNEQGCDADHGNARRTPTCSPALPVDASGVSFPSCVRPSCETVEPVNRPPDARRQGPIAAERNEAR